MGTRNAILLVLACLPLVAMQERPDAFDERMRDAETMLSRGQFDDALRTFKQANGLRDRKSAAAMLGIARAHMGLRDPKKAIDAATDALKFAAGDVQVEAGARNTRGLAHFALGADKVTDRRWKQAEEDFRAALALSDDLAVVRYNLGVALLRQGRDGEGVHELERFLGRAPDDANAVNARRYIATPRRARENFAPDFELRTLDGSSVSLESLSGKIVLVDFWATWCGPCVQATPGLARIHKKLDSPSFVILGVSADRNAATWQKFIDDKKLGWSHYLDDKRTIADRFGVNGYPTYILIDHEGVIRYRQQGWNPSVDGEIEHEAKKLLKELARVGTGTQ